MIGFVVLHYGCKTIHNTIDCVKSINDNFLNIEKVTIVVDNGSNDQSYETLIKQCKILNFELIRSVNNLGFAKGNNLGVQHLMKYSPQFYFVMNNDIIVNKFDYDRLINLHCIHNFSAFGPRIVSASNDNQNPVRRIVKGNTISISLSIIKHRLLLTFLGRPLATLLQIYERIRYSKNPSKKNEIILNKPLYGAFIVFSGEYVIYTNGNVFYPDTFMFLEEDILYYMLRKQKRITLIDNSFVVNHLEDASTNSVFLTDASKKNFKISNIINSLHVFRKLIKEKTL
jgi:GT2 family glycosyltransferase